MTSKPLSSLPITLPIRPPGSPTSDPTSVSAPGSTSNPTAGSPRIVPCPTCGGDSIFAPSNPWRPFCGQRCRQIDLGHWADESFRVPAPPTTEDEDDAGQ